MWDKEITPVRGSGAGGWREELSVDESGYEKEKVGHGTFGGRG